MFYAIWKVTIIFAHCTECELKQYFQNEGGTDSENKLTSSPFQKTTQILAFCWRMLSSQLIICWLKWTASTRHCYFDRTSFSKWPIFFYQNQLSNGACRFSPRENDLRLNNNLTGETRKLVGMQLITGQELS